MKSPRPLIAPIFFALVYLWSAFVFWHEPTQQRLRKLFPAKEREILAVAIGRVMPKQDAARILKVRTPQGISIELQGPAEDGPRGIIDSLLLPDRHDASTQFMARATNLALKDMDGDQVFEIIAPTLDNSLMPRLNILKFNTSNRKLEHYNQ